MSIVAVHLYRSGKKVKSVSLNEPIDCKGKSEFVWIGLSEPSEQELEQLEKNYGLHGGSRRFSSLGADIRTASTRGEARKESLFDSALRVDSVCVEN